MGLFKMTNFCVSNNTIKKMKKMIYLIRDFHLDLINTKFSEKR